MTSLFLYGLGFFCLLFVVALIWDSHYENQRANGWGKNIEQPDEEPADSGRPGNNTATRWKNALPMRPRIFNVKFLTVTAASVSLFIAFKKHEASTTPAPAANENALIQGRNTQNMSSGMWHLPADGAGEYSWNSMATLRPQVETIENDSDRLAIVNWMLGMAWLPNSEAGFNPPADLDLNLGLSAIEDEFNADDSSSYGDADQMEMESLEMLSNCSLDGTLVPDLSLTMQTKPALLAP